MENNDLYEVFDPNANTEITDIPDEVNTETADEFETPSDGESETAYEFDVPDPTDPAKYTTAPNGVESNMDFLRYTDTDLSDLYTEAADENDRDGLCSDGDCCENKPSPEDEQAATSDFDQGCGCGCEDYDCACEKCKLDEYEIISDVLGCEKQLVKLYSTALCESAEESLRGIIKDNLLECAEDQFAAYEYMEKRGMYPTEQAPEEKVSEAQQMFGEIN